MPFGKGWFGWFVRRGESIARVVILMGVSGSGKSTVGAMLADRLGCAFFDADDFHPAANKEKMARGIPLTDADRRPWLEALRNLVGRHHEEGTSMILACSALKGQYRESLRGGGPNVEFVYLKGSFSLILDRLQARQGHYMKADMLQSQFNVLEEPLDATTVEIDGSVESIVDRITRELEAAKRGTGICDA